MQKTETPFLNAEVEIGFGAVCMLAYFLGIPNLACEETESKQVC